MRRSFSWPASSRPATAIAVAVLAGSLAGRPLGAATVLSKEIAVEIHADGTVSEATRLRVRLDTDGDFDAWSLRAVELDENVELEALEAWVERPGGKVERIGRRDLDTLAASPDWVTHGSARLRTVRFPRAGAGAVLALDSRTRSRPYFPGLLLPLGEAAAVESLEVRVRSSAAPFRWSLSGGSLAGSSPSLLPGPADDTAGDRLRLDLRGSLEAAEEPPFGPSEAAAGATLRLVWGRESDDWSRVGRWWESLMGEVPRDAAAVRARALELAPAELSRRQRVERLLAFARRDVRYVAVEVGVGGYRAAAPGETLGRLWGDCKAKAVLLVDLLRAIGLEGYPVLITAGTTERAATEIPSPIGFNHMIVAIPADGLAEDGDPVADGLLFVDPTHPRASLAWLPPSAQDQDALLVAGEASRLVHTPIVASRERERLEASLTLEPDGAAAGDVALLFEGATAAALLEVRDAGDRQVLDRLVRAALESRFPAATLERLTFSEDTARPVPQVILGAALRSAAFATVAAETAMLSLAGSERTPPASILDGRSVPVIASPGVTERVFVLAVPSTWSLAAGEESGEENAVGAFRLRLATSPSADPTRATLRVERRTEIRQRWIDPASFPELRALSLAEHRGARKRIRLAISP